MTKYVTFILFLLTVPLANFMIGNVGTFCVPDGPCLIPLGFGIMAPSGVLMIGAALILRDLVHESLGVKWSLAAIGLGAVLSYLLADPFIAIASLVAFAISELSDYAVYVKIREKSKELAMLLSGIVGSTIDSAIFLYLAFGSLLHIEGQIIGKILFTVIAVLAIKLWRDYDPLSWNSNNS